jgi:hypothetical protein
MRSAPPGLKGALKSGNKWWHGGVIFGVFQAFVHQCTWPRGVGPAGPRKCGDGSKAVWLHLWGGWGRRPQVRGFRAGGSLAVASSTPATQRLLPAMMLNLNQAEMWVGSDRRPRTLRCGALLRLPRGVRCIARSRRMNHFWDGPPCRIALFGSGSRETA